jgi:hypothetical protein
MTERLISIQRRRNQKVLLINTQLIKPKSSLFVVITNGLVAFFTGLDALSRSRLIWVAVVGIGIGLGFSITMTKQPTIVGAMLPQLVVSSPDNGLIIPTAVQLPFSPSAHQLQWDTTSGELNESQVVVASMEQTADTEALGQLSVGEVLRVIGSNEGVYTHRVTEVTHSTADQLPSIIQQESNVLIVYAPTNIFKTEYLVIKAKPV